MSVRNKPNYGIYPIPLTSTGSQDLPIIGTRIIFLTALNGATFANVAGQTIVTGGTPAPSAIVNVSIGKALGDPVPFAINGKINVRDKFEYLRLTWAAQPGVTAFFLIDDDQDGAGVEADSPVSILGGTVSITGSGGLVGTTAAGALKADISDQYTAGANTIAAVGTGASQTIVTAVANVNGIKIRRALLVQSVAGGASINCSAVAPVSAVSQGAFLAANGVGQLNLPHPLLFPAGLGLFFFGTANSFASLGYDLL